MKANQVFGGGLSAPPGHVIGQGPAPGGGVVPCGGGGRGECTFLRYYDFLVKKRVNFWSKKLLF